MTTDIDGLVSALRQTLPIDQLERHERELKDWLLAMFTKPLRGEQARFVAEVQKRIGFLFKFKSYAVKCATPLGYSIFFQQPGEGFSFQRHLTHKVEVFHILEPLAGARVFLCDSQSWDDAYDRRSFSRWLDGEPDASFDCFARTPSAGDVYHVHCVGIVHSVLGCVLEEFANASTDMVDRLHDQNEGRRAEPLWSPDQLRSRLRNTPIPETSAVLEAMGGERVPVADLPMQGARMRVLAAGRIDARRIAVDAGATTGLQTMAARATTIFIARGAGRAVVCDEEEARGQTPPAIEVEAGDVLLVSPHAYFGFVAGNQPLEVVQHSVDLDVLTA